MKSIQISKAAEVDGSFDENEYIPFFEFIPHGDLCDVTSRMVEFVRIVLRSYGVPLRDGFNPYFDIMDFKILLSFGIRKKFVPPRVEIDIEISLDQNGQKITHQEIAGAVFSIGKGLHHRYRMASRGNHASGQKGAIDLTLQAVGPLARDR